MRRNAIFGFGLIYELEIWEHLVGPAIFLGLLFLFRVFGQGRKCMQNYYVQRNILFQVVVLCTSFSSLVYQK